MSLPRILDRLLELYGDVHPLRFTIVVPRRGVFTDMNWTPADFQVDVVLSVLTIDYLPLSLTAALGNDGRYRSLVNDVSTDPIFTAAAQSLRIQNIGSCLPRAIMFVNPGCVKVLHQSVQSCRAPH